MSHSVPTEAITIYNHALELSNRGDFHNALNEYRKAISIYPHFIEAYNNIGEIYSHLGEIDHALTTYMEALKIEKNDRVLLNIGVEHYNIKNYDKALQYFTESLTLNPDFLEGNYYTGLVYYNQKNLFKAEKFLIKILDNDKKHLKANYLLSHIYYEWKDYKRTIACLDNIKDIADDKSFINKYYGFCYYYLGNYDNAVKYLTVALESKPEYKKFKKYLASLTVEKKMKEIGDLDKAIKELEDKLMKAPALNEATTLSMLYIFKGENNKAEKLLISFKEKMAS